MECLHALRAWAMVHDHLHRAHQSRLDQRTWSMLYKSASQGLPPCEFCNPLELRNSLTARFPYACLPGSKKSSGVRNFTRIRVRCPAWERYRGQPSKIQSFKTTPSSMSAVCEQCDIPLLVFRLSKGDPQDLLQPRRPHIGRGAQYQSVPRPRHAHVKCPYYLTPFLVPS